MNTVEDLATWITDRVKNNRFGEIHVTIKLNAGDIALVERSFVEKIRPTETGHSGGTHGKKTS